MKMVLLNVYEDFAKVVEVEDKLEDFYKNLDCDCIDIVQRKIGGKWFDVMCDDEGLYRSDQKISAINDMGQPMLVGNLMFFKHDEAGNTIGLEAEEIEHIQRYIQTMCTRNHPEGYKMLTQCEY